MAFLQVKYIKPLSIFSQKKMGRYTIEVKADNCKCYKDNLKFIILSYEVLFSQG